MGREQLLRFKHTQFLGVLTARCLCSIIHVIRKCSGVDGTAVCVVLRWIEILPWDHHLPPLASAGEVAAGFDKSHPD
jgi:hypothetical protein